MRPKLNLDGLNEQQRQEVIEQYEEWVAGQLDDYFAQPLTADVNEEQQEALEYILES